MFIFGDSCSIIKCFLSPGYPQHWQNMSLSYTSLVEISRKFPCMVVVCVLFISCNLCLFLWLLCLVEHHVDEGLSRDFCIQELPDEKAKDGVICYSAKSTDPIWHALVYERQTSKNLTRHADYYGTMKQHDDKNRSTKHNLGQQYEARQLGQPKHTKHDNSTKTTLGTQKTKKLPSVSLWFLHTLIW